MGDGKKPNSYWGFLAESPAQNSTLQPKGLRRKAGTRGVNWAFTRGVSVSSEPEVSAAPAPPDFQVRNGPLTTCALPHPVSGMSPHDTGALEKERPALSSAPFAHQHSCTTWCPWVWPGAACVRATEAQALGPFWVRLGRRGCRQVNEARDAL